MVVALLVRHVSDVKLEAPPLDATGTAHVAFCGECFILLLKPDEFSVSSRSGNMFVRMIV